MNDRTEKVGVYAIQYTACTILNDVIWALILEEVYDIINATKTLSGGHKLTCDIDNKTEEVRSNAVNATEPSLVAMKWQIPRINLFR